MMATDAAYLAAVLDGEGHLSITRRQLVQCRWATYGGRIGIANTNRAWLEQFQQQLGGWLRQVGKPTTNRKPCFSLVFEGEAAARVLFHARPFLRLKVRQGDLLLKYFELAAKRKTETPRGGTTNQGVIAELDALYLEMKQINMRGTSGETPRRNQPQGRVCGIDGCGRGHFGRGYCKIHYKKFIIRGGPKKHDKECVECHRPFVSKRSDAQRCSDRCRAAARLKRQSPTPE